ncbi:MULTISPECIES: hypothetical protein [Streptomyces]|uniref:hypothetical protein n=1 Tax=Streptomyces TaxID=1883 RepID=UPI000CD51F58|nr:MULTISPECIES: hypothetical protein [unclassified Streptomyces]
MNRPLLFLDVDGPLNPYAAKPERRPDGYTTLRVPRNDAHQDDRGHSSRRPLRVWLNPKHGRSLLQLGFELCWATTWMDDANRWIGPRENDFHSLADFARFLDTSRTTS